MKTLGWVIGIGGALYLLDYLGYFGSSAPATTTSGASASGGTTTTVQATNPNAAIQQNTLNQMIAALNTAGVDPNSYQTVWTWNYYYQQVRGIPVGPDPTTILPNNPNADTEKISLGEYWGGMTAAGFSGLGVIARHVNPYLQGPRHDKRQAFGAGLAPTGMETYIKEVN